MNKLFSKNLTLIIIIFLFGVTGGFYLDDYYKNSTTNVIADDLRLDDQEATIRAIKKVKPAVVSIIVYSEEELIEINIESGEQITKKEDMQKGKGTGFLISSDGLIITNKHVVEAGEEDLSSYRVILNSGKKYYAQLIGKDPINDLAVLKIFDKNLPYIEMGDSAELQIGTTVIAIGNALGLYENSATKGIVSGLSRDLIASDQMGSTQSLINLIQTDATINVGNSGGPLINLEGKVIGINTATESSGSDIGFAIPVNDARAVIKSVRETGRIVRPMLGVRYIMITPEIAVEENLARENGALIISSEDGGVAIVPGSPADEGGLLEDDIIFEINAIKIEGINNLFSIIQRYKPGDKIGLKIQRGEKVIIRVVELDEF